MTDINISAARDPISGKLKGSYVEVAEGVNFIGTVGHGNTLTITDSLARFGTRTNAKPLFVNFGDSLSGSALGRDTGSHLSSNLTTDSVVKLGSLMSSYKLDIKQHGSGGLISPPITTTDQTKPLIQYIERRYGFDYADPRIQNNTFYIKQWGYENTFAFSLTIDGRTYTYTNDGTAGSVNNGGVVRDDFIAQINADALCKCTASNNSGTLLLTKKVVSDYFDVTYNSSIYQNFNNKTARIYAWDNSGSNDVYLISAAAGAGSSHTNVENTSGSVSTPYYDAKQDASAWMCEEFVLKNSSAGGVSDGYYNHYKNSELLNSGNSIVTYNVGQQPLGRCYLNQFSNGEYGYWRADLPMNIGYQCWDDEYNAIYLADSATITSGTKKVRQPQLLWFANRCNITLIESHVPLSGAHVHVRTGLSTFIHLGQLPS